MYPIYNSIVSCRSDETAITRGGTEKQRARLWCLDTWTAIRSGAVGEVGAGGVGGEVELFFPVWIDRGDLGDDFLDCASDVQSGTSGSKFEVPDCVGDGVAWDGSLGPCQNLVGSILLVSTERNDWLSYSQRW